MMKVFSRASFSFGRAAFFCPVFMTNTLPKDSNKQCFIYLVSAFSFGLWQFSWKQNFPFHSAAWHNNYKTKRDGRHAAASAMMSTWKVLFVKWLRAQNWTLDCLLVAVVHWKKKSHPRWA